MAPGSSNGGRPHLPSRWTATPARRLVLTAGAGILAIALVIGALVGINLLRRGIRTAGRAARFTYSAATLRLYRRCPDCKRMIRSDARVCRHCGYRKPPPMPRGRRARRRAARQARGQVATPA